jgi:hypothetical protein
VQRLRELVALADEVLERQPEESVGLVDHGRRPIT